MSAASVALLVALSAAPVVQPQNPFDANKAFTATQIGDLLHRQDPVKVSRLGDQLRIDDEAGYSITELDGELSYSIDKEHNTCSRFPGPFWRSFPFSSPISTSKLDRKPLPEEVVDGHHCKVEILNVIREDAAPTEWKFWEAQDLNGFPIKVEIKFGSGRQVAIAFKDVVLKAPDATLFKPPDQCKKIARRPPVPGGTVHTKPSPPKNQSPAPAPAPQQGAPPASNATPPR